MIVVAVLGILFAGFACAGMSFVGARSFAKSHDWHYAVGAGLYALGAMFFIGWVFSMGWEERRKTMKFFKRIKIYFFLKNLGINRPWKASGDKNFITVG